MEVYLVDVVHLLLEDDSLLGQVTQALTRLLHHTPNRLIAAVAANSNSKNSVADPDPYVFGPAGSGSFYNQAKLVSKTLIPTVL